MVACSVLHKGAHIPSVYGNTGASFSPTSCMVSPTFSPKASNTELMLESANAPTIASSSSVLSSSEPPSSDSSWSLLSFPSSEPVKSSINSAKEASNSSSKSSAIVSPKDALECARALAIMMNITGLPGGQDVQALTSVMAPSPRSTSKDSSERILNSTLSI